MSSDDARRVAFLGGGKMAEALVSGLIRSGGRSVDEIMVTNRRDERAHELAGKYGITATLDNAEAASRPAFAPRSSRSSCPTGCRSCA